MTMEELLAEIRKLIEKYAKEREQQKNEVKKIPPKPG